MKTKLFSKIFAILVIVAMLLPMSTAYGITIDSLDFYDKLDSAAYDIRGTVNGGEKLSTTYDDRGYQVHFRVSGENEEIDDNYSEIGMQRIIDFFANDPNCPPYPEYPSSLPKMQDFETYEEFMTYLTEHELNDVYTNYGNEYSNWMDYAQEHYDEYIEYMENNPTVNQTEKVNTQEVFVYKMENGGTIENNGVTLKIVGSKISNNNVKVEYIIKNESNSSKNYALSIASDIEFGDNDSAAVAKDNHNSMQITQDDEYYESTYKAQMKISFSPAVDTAWIGYYAENVENRYKESDEIYYTVQDDEDTGLAYSWNGTLAAGETKTLSAAFDLQEAIDGKINFFSDGNETSTQDSSKTGLVGGGITMPETKECDEEGYIYVWATNREGTGEVYGSGVGAIINTAELNLYEVKVKEMATMHFETNGGNAMEDLTQKVGTKLSIPTPTKAGAEFVGWYLDNDTFENKVNYQTMPTGNTTVYAKWNNKATNEEKKSEEPALVEEPTLVNEGIIDKIEPEKPNFGKADIETDISKLKEIALTEKDIELMKEGNDIHLYVEVKDISDSISEEEKALIEKAKDDSVIGIFLDINLFKQIGDNKPEKITKTNGKIKISFEIPEELINKDSSINRTFYILKLHDGVVTKLPVTVDGTTGTFETDEFSTYALAYTDTKIEESVTTLNPETGDNIAVWITLMAVSILGIVGTVKFGNKRK